MRQATLCGLCILIVLAGCNGLISESSDQETTVTPAPVPTTDQFAPGVTNGGVSNLSALETAHYSRLQNTSHTSRFRSVVTAANGTVVSERRTTTQVAAQRVYRVRHLNSSSPLEESPSVPLVVRSELWAVDERGLFARTLANGTTVYLSTPAENSPLYENLRSQPGSDSIQLLEPSATGVAGRVSEDGRSLYRLQASELDQNELLRRYGTEANNSRLTAFVTPQGAITRLNWRYEITLEDTTYLVERSLRYTRVGNTTLSRPSWYDEAVNATNAANRSAS
jgi:hypothetical protein